MRRLSLLLLATVLLSSSSLVMARTSVVSNAQENCPGANAEAEASSLGMESDATQLPPAEKAVSPRQKASNKSANGLGRNTKSRWRALLPGTMR